MLLCGLSRSWELAGGKSEENTPVVDAQGGKRKTALKKMMGKELQKHVARVKMGFLSRHLNSMNDR